MSRFAVCLAACVAVVSLPGRGLAGPVVLDDIKVVARPEPHAAGPVQEVDLSGEGPAPATVADVMTEVAGFDVQRRSIMTPKASQVRMRGLDERRYLVLIDGRPLNGAGVMGGYFVDWSALALTNWRKMEVSRGAYSARHGNTLGGYLDLKPAKPESGRVRLSGGAGSYGTWNVGARSAFRKGRAGLGINMEHRETNGHLRNSGADRNDVATALFYDIPDGEIDLRARFMSGKFYMPVENHAGAPGYDGSYPDSKGMFLTGPWLSFPAGDRHGDDSNYTKKRQEYDLTVRKSLAPLAVTGRLYYNNETRTDEIRSYNTGDLVLQRDTTPDRTWGWSLDMLMPIAAHRLGFGADGSYQGFGGIDNTFVKSGYFSRPPHSASDEWDATRQHGLYLDDNWALGDDLDVYLGLRFERYEGDQSVDAVSGYNAWGYPTGISSVDATIDNNVLLPKFGVAFRPAAGLELHANVARAARMPDNPAFYWYYSGWRPEVDPRVNIVRKPLTYEDAVEYEAGVSLAGSDAVRAGLSLYYNRVKDYIRWIYGYTPSRVVYNIDRVDFWGCELTMDGRVGDAVSLSASMTWQDSRKKGDVLDATGALTDSISELPDFKASLGAGYRYRNGVTARITFRYVGSREVPVLNNVDAPDGASIFSSGVRLGKLDAFSTTDIDCTIPLKLRWQSRLTLGVGNVFNKGYQEEFDVPAPDRRYSAAIDVVF